MFGWIHHQLAAVGALLSPGPRAAAGSARVRRVLQGLILGAAVSLLGVALYFSPPGGALEQRVGSVWLFGMRGAIDPPAEVVVVGIDSQTGTALGLPASPQDWPRSVHARMIERLVDLGAAVIVFDVYFGQRKNTEDDAAFEAAVRRADRVVLVEKLTGKRQPLASGGSVWVEQLLPPLPALAGAARGLGPFPLPKIDAAVYEFWAFKSSAGDAPTLPAVALQLRALRAWPAWGGLVPGVASDAGEPAVPAGLAERLHEEMVRLRRAYAAESQQRVGVREAIERARAEGAGARELAAMRSLDALYAGEEHRTLNFYGPPGQITTVAFQTLLAATGDTPVALPDLQGKVVFIGFSDLYDPGQPDRFYTVFTNEEGVDLSGVEIAATAFANLLEDAALRHPAWPVVAGLLLVFGIALGMAACALPSSAGVPLALVSGVLYAGTAHWLFGHKQLLLPMAVPLLLQLPLAVFAGLLTNYLWEKRRGEHVSRAINYYLPEGIARELAEGGLDPGAANRVAYATCLATDMAGFSALAEKLPPAEVARILNDYFDTLAAPLKRNGVNVTEFRADAIMCAWTADAPNHETRARAVEAALQSVAAIAGFRQRNALYAANLRIGLECGTVFVGHAGGGGHFVFSIVGDCANTASRIEGLNKHLGTQLLASEAVMEGLTGILARPLGHFQFVGKSESLPIVEIVARRTEASEAQVRLCEQFAEGLAYFAAARWSDALEGFGRILAYAPDDGPARFFAARCKSYLDGAATPADPSIVRMESK